MAKLIKLLKSNIFKLSVISLLSLILVNSTLLVFSEKENILNKIKKFSSSKKNDLEPSMRIKNIDREISKKILQGGFILVFRHAEKSRLSKQSLGPYDIVEVNNNIKAEDHYFETIACLSKEGKMQARLLSDIFKDLNMPVSKLVSSPSCRARQTLEFIGKIDATHNELVYFNAWHETFEQYSANVKNILLRYKPEEKQNVIISAHNSVITRNLFDKVYSEKIQYQLEEGGFYVIKHNGESLELIYKFNSLFDFISSNYKRPLDN